MGERPANDREEVIDDGFGFDFSDEPVAESVPVKKEETPAKVEESSNKRHVDQLNADFDNDIDRALAQLSPPPGTRPAPGIKFDGPGTLDVAPDRNLEKTGVYDRGVLEAELRKMTDVIELTDEDVRNMEDVKVEALRKKIVKIPELPRLQVAPQFRRTPAVMPPPRTDRVAIGAPPKPAATPEQAPKSKEEASALSKLSALWDRYNPFKKAA